ncbi:hypothetical protein N0V88_003210 [Collariella sp. IMI 366227]|nr:hypothetical protein N0V88_003210 [Collariella sp. IMI 366227]
MDPSAQLDPATGQPLPADAIVRVLLHVYSIPRTTIATTAGYAASSWTTDPRSHIFTARLRILETSFSSPATTTTQPQQNQEDVEQETQQQLKIDILLEDPATAALFAAAPTPPRPPSSRPPIAPLLCTARARSERDAEGYPRGWV